MCRGDRDRKIRWSAEGTLQINATHKLCATRAIRKRGPPGRQPNHAKGPGLPPRSSGFCKDDFVNALSRAKSLRDVGYDLPTLQPLRLRVRLPRCTRIVVMAIDVLRESF